MLTQSPSLAHPDQGLSGVQFLKMCARVRSTMDRRRYGHVLGVARTAERLARRHGVSTLKARTAGMLHDVARQWSAEALLAYAFDHGLNPGADEQAMPVLLHARVGADVAQRQFGVSDAQTLAAISHHTVAVAGMSDLEKILYIADSIEPGRRLADSPALTALAERDLDAAMLGCVTGSLKYLIEHRRPIAAQTLALYNELVRPHEA